MIISALSGFALIGAGLMLLGRARLLSGRCLGWPEAPKWVRLVLLIGGFALAGQGVAFARQPAADWHMGYTAFVVLAVEAALFINLWRQRTVRK